MILFLAIVTALSALACGLLGLEKPMFALIVVTMAIQIFGGVGGDVGGGSENCGAGRVRWEC